MSSFCHYEYLANFTAVFQASPLCLLQALMPQCQAKAAAIPSSLQVCSTIIQAITPHHWVFMGQNQQVLYQCSSAACHGQTMITDVATSALLYCMLHGPGDVVISTSAVPAHHPANSSTTSQCMIKMLLHCTLRVACVLCVRSSAVCCRSDSLVASS
jgi:hypothetical protein